MYIANEENVRNELISKKLLLGASVTEVASIYGISRDRCVQILRGYCSRQDREVYMSITGRVSKPPGINQLRKYVDAFIDNDYGEEVITVNSAIWRIKEFPIKIVNALEFEGIYTVEELLNTDTTMLKRIPGIGNISIEIIEKFRIRFEQNNSLLESSSNVS